MRHIKTHMTVLLMTLAFLIIAGFVFILPFQTHAETIFNNDEDEWDNVIGDIFRLRNQCILKQDYDTLKPLFLTEEKNGRWAYEFEVQRAKYLSNWAAKQGALFTDISSDIIIKSSKQVGRGYSFYVLTSSEYTYVYANSPETENKFRLGAYHSVDLIPAQDDSKWIISREWYDDPLLDSINMGSVTDDMTAYISGHSPIDLSGISERRIAAVQYADTYCGSASDGQNNYSYNGDYTNYNALGGDCANFASQTLLAGGFKKSGTWNYTGGKGSRAWVNAQGLKNFLVNSGRASVLAKGSYKEIYQYAYSLRPGDIVAYVKKGKVTHVSVVTGADSKGYPLVSCHNLDRNRVPWDMGWSGDSIRFVLLNVSY